MSGNSWVDLERDCPIDISRIVVYAKQFHSKLVPRIEDIDTAKESLMDARGDFDLMITTLIQLLYDRDILKNQQDHTVFMWLREDLGRYMKKLDDREDFLLVEEDFRDPQRNRVSVSRLSSYSKSLKLSADSIIYESLLKATKEYYNFTEDNYLRREKRTFLYILFQILQVTLSVLGSYTREKSTMMKKRGMIDSMTPNWQSLIQPSGQETIKEGFKEEVGKDISDEEINNLFDDLEEDKEDTEIEMEFEEEENDSED